MLNWDKKYSLVFIVLILVFLVSAYAYFSLRTSIETVENLTGLKFPIGAELTSTMRLNDNPESDFLYQINFKEKNGDIFCGHNNIPFGKPEIGVNIGVSQVMPDIIQENFDEKFSTIICYGLISKPKFMIYVAAEKNKVLIYYH